METPNTLTSTLDGIEKPEELRGVVEAELAKTVPPAVAKELAKSLVATQGFDTPQAFREMSYDDLCAAVPSVGHRKRVSRALFNGNALQAEHIIPAGAPPEVNVTVAAPVKEATWRIEWPENCSPESILDWGLQVRAHLRKRDEDFSELVWDRYVKPWTDVDVAHANGSDLDQYLSGCLLSVKIPEWAAPLVRNSLTQWHAVLAIQAVCRQVFLRTDLSDKQLKRRVRDPAAEATVGGVALRLASWDSDLSTCVDARKFIVDDHDRKEALKQIVEGLSSFKPALEAFENKTGGYTWKELRDRLGIVADEHKARITVRKKALVNVPAPRPAGSGTSKKKRSKEKRAAEAVAAVSRAMQKLPPQKAKPKSQRKKLCSFFRDHGSCKYGDKCYFSHGEASVQSVEDWRRDNRFSVLSDMTDASERGQLVCAALRFFDGENGGRSAGWCLQVLRQAALTKRVTKTIF